MTALTENDRLEIAATVRRADQLATQRDVAGYLALTTPDMVLDGDQGTASGTDAIRAAIASIWSREPHGTHHVTSDIVITADADGTAEVKSTMTLVDSDRSSATVLGAASITQSLRRSERGWLIAHRNVQTLPPQT